MRPSNANRRLAEPTQFTISLELKLSIANLLTVIRGFYIWYFRWRSEIVVPCRDAKLGIAESSFVQRRQVRLRKPRRILCGQLWQAEVCVLGKFAYFIRSAERWVRWESVRIQFLAMLRQFSTIVTDSSARSALARGSRWIRMRIYRAIRAVCVHSADFLPFRCVSSGVPMAETRCHTIEILLLGGRDFHRRRAAIESKD